MTKKTKYRELEERVQELEALKATGGKNQAGLEHLFNLSLDMLCVADIDGYFRSINDAFEKTLGYTKEEIYEHPFIHFVHPDDKTPTMGAVAQLSKGEPVTYFENRYRCKDGSYKWLAWTSMPVPEQGLTYGVGRDITDRKRIEEGLKLHGEIVKNMAEGVCLIRSIDGVIVYANPKFESMFGYDFGKLVGKHVSIVNAPTEKGPEEIADEIIQSVKEKGTWSGEVYNIRKDGTPFWCNANVSTFDHPDFGEIWIAVHEDISRRKKAEEELRRHQEHLEHLVEERTTELSKANEQLRREVEDRKRAEEVLRESEERYRDLYENAPVMYHTIDTKGIVLECNQTEADMLGHSKEEIIGKPIYAFETKEYQDVAPRALRDAAEKGHIVGERRFVKKDGTIIDIAFEGTAIYDDSGQVVGFRSTLTDISHLKQAEEALRESELRYRSLFESSPIGIGLSTTNGEILEYNDRMVQLTGYARGELEKVNVRDLYENPGERAGLMKQLEEEGIVRDYEAKLKRKDGTPFYVNLSMTPVSLGGEDVLLTALQDITDRKQTEEALQESEEKYRTILESIEDGYYEVDIAGNFTFLNDSLCRKIRYTRDELMGMNNREYMDEVTAKKVYQSFNRVYATGKPDKGFEYEIIRKDGTPINVEVSISLIRDSEDHRVGFRGIVRDITERKQAEVEKDALRRNLESLWGLVQLAEHDMKSLCDYVLKEVAEQTASPYVSYGFLNEDESEYLVYSWSPDVMEDCKTQDKPLRFPIENAGLWASALRKRAPMIINDYDKPHPGKQGLPAGHVPLKRLMLVPVFSKGRIAAFGAVANKEAEYQEKDLKQLSAFLTSAQILMDRKKADEEITKLAKFPAENPNPVLRISKDGTILYGNESSLPIIELWQCKKGERVSGEWHRLIMEILSSGRSQETETRCDDKVYSLTFAPVKAGDFVNVYGFDITERKRAEEALRESERKYYSLFNEAQDGIVLVDSETGHTVDCNPEFESQTGRKLEQLKKMKVWELRPPQKVGAAKKKFYEIKENGTGDSAELEFQKPDGEIVYIEFKAKGVKVRGREYLQSIVRDITERKRAEEALRESQELLHKTFDSLNEAVFVVDASTRTIIECNPAVEHIFGYSKEEVVGHNTEFLHVDRARYNRFGEELFPALDGEGVFQTEFQMRRKNGEIFFTEHTVTEMADEIGHRIGLVSIVRDITERKQAEEKLKQYSEMLEDMVEGRTRELKAAQEQMVRREKLATLGQVAGSMAHELRNPLGAIRNSAYFLNATLKDPGQEVKEALEILEKEVVTSERIIKSLLDFTHREVPMWRNVDINDIVQGALSRTPVPETVQVVSQLGETLPIIPGDPEQLIQAFGNLILNAVQAMPEGGRLVVKSEAPSEEQVTVSFTDTGGGMDEETLSKAFEPLFTTKAKGIGLGLALARMMVQAHGGTIDIESEKGKGSTFTVSLPTKIREKGAKILVVDDDKEIRDILTEILATNRPYQLEEASNGTEALIKLGTYRPDLLILDVMMPEMDGLEVCRTIRSEPKLSHMKVIIITGFPDHPKVKEVEELGFTNIHTKPIKLQRLLSEVDNALLQPKEAEI